MYTAPDIHVARDGHQEGKAVGASTADTVFTRMLIWIELHSNPPMANLVGKRKWCHSFTGWLIGRYTGTPGRQCVLLMGPVQEQGRKRRRGIVLILLHQHENIWVRIGISHWWAPEDMLLNKQFFHVKGEDWSYGEGLFGYVKSSMKFV